MLTECLANSCKLGLMPVLYLPHSAIQGIDCGGCCLRTVKVPLKLLAPRLHFNLRAHPRPQSQPRLQYTRRNRNLSSQMLHWIPPAARQPGQLEH